MRALEPIGGLNVRRAALQGPFWQGVTNAIAGRREQLSEKLVPNRAVLQPICEVLPNQLVGLTDRR